jgi:acyl carrier protein
MYKTGDLARYRADGGLEYLGRVDSQVKVRGHRVELGEIEAAVAAYPGVRSCAVVLREDAPGEKDLVAYVVREPQASAQPLDLRDHLKQVLPDFMVPSHVVALDALPLTRNGKVDRDALPAPQPAAPATPPGDTGVSPTEQVVAQIWAGFLKRDTLGRDEDLFAAGANSMLAVRALAKMRDTFGIPLAIRTVFEFPTIAELADAIDRLKLVHAGAARGGGEREEIEL